MIERRLHRQLNDAVFRYHRTLLTTRLAVVWLALAAAAALLIALNLSRGFYAPGAHIAFIVVTVLVTLGTLYLTRPAMTSPGKIAQRIETQFPELQSRLLTAMEQRPQLPNDRFGYLQHNVIQEAVVHGYRHDWRNIVPSWRYLLSHMACLLALTAVVASTVGMFRFIQPSEQNWIHLFFADRGETRVAAELLAVEPGDADVERGTSLLVLARFAGQLPKEVSLIVEDDRSQEARQLGMTQSLDDPTFGGRLQAIDAALSYRVVYDGRRSDLYRVSVFEFPRCSRRMLNLTTPTTRPWTRPWFRTCVTSRRLKGRP